MNTRHVVVVDDNVDDVRALKRHLSRDTRNAYSVTVTTTAAEGLRLIEEQRPAVAILDQLLGVGLGTELLQQLRQRGHRDLAIVLLTGSIDDDSEVDPLELGADDYLKKDEVSGPQLRRALSNAITKARMRAALEQKEAALAQALGEVERRMAFERRLIGVVSHDLRTPIGAVVAAAQLMVLEGGLSDRGRQVVARLTRTAQHMGNLVDQILDLTKLRKSGGLQVDPATHDVVVLARETIQRICDAQDCDHITYDGPPAMQAEVDRIAFGQVVENLVSNAVKHGAPGEPVRVALSDTGNALQLTVSNSGPRIPAELLDTLFEPFVRGEHSSGRGLGLGLFITHEWVRAHGGDIHVESDDQRTTVRVRFPRDRVAADSAPSGGLRAHA